MMWMENIIKIDEVSCQIEGNKLLDKLSLNIEENSWVSIVGPNGSGKSILIKILSGLLPYTGYINIDNLVLDKENIKEVRRKIGVVLDNLENQFVGQTVEDDLKFPLENLNYKEEEIKKNVTNITNFFHINLE